MEQFELSYTLAIKYLSFRQRSEKEVRDYLLKKRMPLTTIEEVIRRLKKQRFLDDEEFARLWVESRKRAKPRSTWLLKRELSQKGVAEAIIVSLMGESSERGDDLSLAKDAIAKRIEKYRNLPRVEVYQKVGGFLARRGFSWDVSKAAIDALLKERYNDDE